MTESALQSKHNGGARGLRSIFMWVKKISVRNSHNRFGINSEANSPSLLK
ncbi:MAG: hypothetical protein WBF90_34185 [Rivularia sp. (in: cyanobacteria)]